MQIPKLIHTIHEGTLKWKTELLIQIQGLCSNKNIILSGVKIKQVDT